MKFWVVGLVLPLLACNTSQVIQPLVTETSVPASPTVHLIEVTRVIMVEQTVIVTPTPAPLLAQKCFDMAVTQLDLSGCAAEERFLAQAELEDILSRIELPPEEKEELDQLQQEWEILVERNCMFYYDKWGSMRPMQQSMCIALRIKERTQELKLVYLTPDG